MGKIVYITAKTPFGSQETFILTEMFALKKRGVDMLIIPRDKSSEILHGNTNTLIESTLSTQWINFQVVVKSLMYIFSKPISFIKLMNDITLKAGSAKTAFKNLVILPKSLYLSMIINKESISHIHAHWASTVSTMAYIISQALNIPWSFTAHRWDIPENNMLENKCKTASFIRAIDNKGSEEIKEIVNNSSLNKKIKVIHMGVDIPNINKTYIESEIYTILCPANFETKKGHEYLFEACKMLLNKGVKFRCLLAGNGPNENKLKKMVYKFNLNNNIKFLGRLSHERLFDLYSSGKVDAVVLPSILTDNGAKEGIPVALMEAMAYGVPVISTDTGGNYELIGDGSGIMIKERDSKAIANAIGRLKNDTTYCNALSKAGRDKIIRDFNVSVISEELMKLFSQYSQ